jgi:tetratricopeptide (TPR) repeat protein
MSSKDLGNSGAIPPHGPIPAGRWVTPEENKAKAKKFFEHARKATEQRNYDYSIKLYTDGLMLWPDAMEEGLKPLRVVAMARKLDGGKPAGFLDSRKHAGGKDFLVGLNNALYLFGLDPTNFTHMEHILHLASKSRCDRVVQWISPVVVDTLNNSKRIAESHLKAACEAMDFAADVAMAAEDDQIAKDILNAEIATAQLWCGHHPDSSDAPRARSNATGKLTIVKGRFNRGEGFTESLKDAEGQQDIRDRDRLMHGADRTRELIVKARKEWAASPDVANKLLGLADKMLAAEDPALETEAISLLTEEFQRTKQYVFKFKADEIQIRQMTREKRDLAARIKTEGGNGELQQTLAKLAARQLAFEIKVLEERCAEYPTELRTKFQLGARYFQAGRYDDAIPQLQQAKTDSRFRTESRLYIGRCFFEKGFLDQAIGTMRQAIDESTTGDGPTQLELNYWLGRSLEASGNLADARNRYGHLIQIDYNFKDARQRLEKLVAEDRH